jgi:hypothetical protein
VGQVKRILAGAVLGLAACAKERPRVVIPVTTFRRFPTLAEIQERQRLDEMEERLDELSGDCGYAVC